MSEATPFLSSQKNNEENAIRLTTEEDILGDNLDAHPLVLKSLYSIKSSQKNESSASVGAMTLVKYFISTGVLALPYIINRLGILPSCFLLLFIGYLNLYCLKLLDQVATHLELVKADLGRLCEKVTRRLWFRYFAEINLQIMCVGTVVTEVVFISEYLGEVSCDLNWTFFCDEKLRQFALILVLVIPAMTVTDLHYLAIPNSIGLLFQLMFCIVFFVASVSLIQENGVAGAGLEAALTKFEFTALPVAFATILYTYEGVGLLMDIRASVRGDTEKTTQILNWSFSLASFTYVIFGTLSVLAYGDDTNSIIFLNLNQLNTLFVIVEFGYLIAIILGIPTVLFSVTRIVENYRIFRRCIVNKKTNTKSKLKRQFIRIPLIILICALASVIPSFNSFLSFLSGINFTIISYVIPVLLYYLQFRDEPGRRFKFLVNWVIMVVGIILGAIAVVQSLIEMINDSTAAT